MTRAEKLIAIAENQQKVYDAGYSAGQGAGGGYTEEDVENAWSEGKRAEHESLWDAIHDSFEKNGYENAFAGACWTKETFKPKRNMTIHNDYMLFRSSRIEGDLPAILEELGVEINTLYYCKRQYAYAYTSFTRLGDFNFEALGNLDGTFINSSKLVTIDKIKVGTNTSFNGSFNNLPALENITFEGTLNTSGLNLQWSPKLSHDSLMSIINALADKSADTSGTQWKVTLGSDNLAKLTAEEKDIAYVKGWDLA